MSSYPLVLLMGPTAVGKTAAAIAIAQAVNGEVINVDSAQVFKGMHIGTAKPTNEELAAVPHHLVDFVSPTEAYSAARFCQDAVQAIDDIRARGRTPVLAGGTMLYFNALVQGLAPLPQADPAVRAELEAEAASVGWPAMHRQLASIDVKAAERIHPNDPQRTQRALEVIRITGKTLSALQADTQSFISEPFMKFALMPTEREWLHERIKRRFMAMLDDGFLDEVSKLKAIGDLSLELPSMRSVGYRQAWQHLNGDTDYHSFVQQGIAATRQLAKRQMTWVRGMEEVTHLPCNDKNSADDHCKRMLAHIANS